MKTKIGYILKQQNSVGVNLTCKWKGALNVTPVSFISFYDVVILAAIMITYLILVFFTLDQAYFENQMKPV